MSYSFQFWFGSDTGRKDTEPGVKFISNSDQVFITDKYYETQKYYSVEAFNPTFALQLFVILAGKYHTDFIVLGKN